jgi:hypothetical protein
MRASEQAILGYPGGQVQKSRMVAAAQRDQQNIKQTSDKDYRSNQITLSDKRTF